MERKQGTVSSANMRWCSHDDDLIHDHQHALWATRASQGAAIPRPECHWAHNKKSSSLVDREVSTPELTRRQQGGLMKMAGLIRRIRRITQSSAVSKKSRWQLNKCRTQLTWAQHELCRKLLLRHEVISRWRWQRSLQCSRDVEQVSTGLGLITDAHPFFTTSVFPFHHEVPRRPVDDLMG